MYIAFAPTVLSLSLLIFGGLSLSYNNEGIRCNLHGSGLCYGSAYTPGSTGKIKVFYFLAIPCYDDSYFRKIIINFLMAQPVKHGSYTFRWIFYSFLSDVCSNRSRLLTLLFDLPLLQALHVPGPVYQARWARWRSMSGCCWDLSWYYGSDLPCWHGVQGPWAKSSWLHPGQRHYCPRDCHLRTNHQ